MCRFLKCFALVLGLLILTDASPADEEEKTISWSAIEKGEVYKKCLLDGLRKGFRQFLIREGMDPKSIPDDVFLLIPESKRTKRMQEMIDNAGELYQICKCAIHNVSQEGLWGTSENVPAKIRQKIDAILERGDCSRKISIDRIGELKYVAIVFLILGSVFAAISYAISGEPELPNRCGNCRQNTYEMSHVRTEYLGEETLTTYSTKKGPKVSCKRCDGSGYKIRPSLHWLPHDDGGGDYVYGDGVECRACNGSGFLETSVQTERDTVNSVYLHTYRCSKCKATFDYGESYSETPTKLKTAREVEIENSKKDSVPSILLFTVAPVVVPLGVMATQDGFSFDPIFWYVVYAAIYLVIKHKNVSSSG